VQMTYWPSGPIKEMFDPREGVYRLYDQAGVLTGSRPLTDPEWASLAGDDLNEGALTAKVAAQVPDLLVMIADLNARLDIPKADLGNTELRRTIRDVKQLARVVTQLVRLVGNVLDSTNSGT